MCFSKFPVILSQPECSLRLTRNPYKCSQAQQPQGPYSTRGLSLSLCNLSPHFLLPDSLLSPWFQVLFAAG